MPDAQQGTARHLYLPAAVAAIGGLLFGFDTAVINGAIVFLKSQFGLNDSQTEIAASSLLLGCVVGASLAAFTSDRFGRKRVLLAAAALFTISSLGTALPRDLTQFVIARVIGGLAIGIASTLSPLYIAEISPARSRGLMVSLNQLAIVIGILLSYSVNYLLTGAGPSNWRWMRRRSVASWLSRLTAGATCRIGARALTIAPPIAPERPGAEGSSWI